MKYAITLNVQPINVQYENEFSNTLNHSYTVYLESLGIFPVLVPNGLQDPCTFVSEMKIDGLILTGGNDISPELYGENSNDHGSYNSTRDQTEKKLLEFAVKRKLPVLGICRGMQFINVFFGGRLVRDLRTQVDQAVNHVGYPHMNEVVNTKIAQLLGVQRLLVNSFHNHGVVKDSLADEVDVFAVSSQDHVIEGILHRQLPILGVQWHPERPGSSPEYDLILIRNFLQGKI